MKSIRTQILGLIAIVAAGALIALGCALLAMMRVDTMNERSSQQNHIALAAERLNAAVNLVVADSIWSTPPATRTSPISQRRRSRPA